MDAQIEKEEDLKKILTQDEETLSRLAAIEAREKKHRKTMTQV